MDERMAAGSAKRQNTKNRKSECSPISHVSPAAARIDNRSKTFKSPSDTTIYSPALRKVNSEDIALIDKISNFVESIKLDSRRDHLHMDNRSASQMAPPGRYHVSPSTLHKQRSPFNRNSGDDVRRVEPCSTGRTKEDNTTARSPGGVADHLVVQAKKFKARVEVPKGNFSQMLLPYDYDKLRTKFVKPEGLAPFDSEILFLHNFDQDDEFFHVTSQIDPSLCIKIERGEFVDLERLLPQDRAMGKSHADDLNKQLYQLITQGTNNFLEPPVPKTGKINNNRKWDQAFRVFAAIYTNANPEQASEIW